MKILLLDTNIFARFLAQDVKSQFEESSNIFSSIENKEAIGKISILVVSEAIYVFEGTYKMDRKDFIPQLLRLLALKNMVIIEADKNVVIDVLKSMINNKFDFTDLYLAKITEKGEEIVSFDKDFAKIAKL